MIVFKKIMRRSKRNFSIIKSKIKMKFDYKMNKYQSLNYSYKNNNSSNLIFLKRNKDKTIWSYLVITKN